MKSYRIIVGYIEYKDLDEAGNLVGPIRKVPLSPYNVIGDSEEIIDYLIESLGVKTHIAVRDDNKRIYLNHQLN